MPFPAGQNLNEQSVLIWSPLISLDVGVEMIEPPLADLLVRAPGHVGSLRTPLETRARNKLHYRQI